MEVKHLTKEYWSQVKSIFIDGILTKNATFMTLEEVPSWKIWSETHLLHSRFVVIKGGNVLGWCALTPYSKKHAYRGVAEVSVYVSLTERGKGIGNQLLKKLVEDSEKNGIWTLQARVYPENKASVHIHKQQGFVDIGTMKKAGQIDGFWRDVIILERRSKKVGN